MKKTLHLKHAQMQRSGYQVCQAVKNPIFNRENKNQLLDWLKHPKAKVGFPGFELKQCRGLSGAASLLLFLFHTTLELLGLSQRADQPRLAEIAARLVNCISLSLLSAAQQNQNSASELRCLCEERVSSHKERAEMQIYHPASWGKHRPFSNSYIWPQLCLLYHLPLSKRIWSLRIKCFFSKKSHLNGHTQACIVRLGWWDMARQRCRISSTH